MESHLGGLIGEGQGNFEELFPGLRRKLLNATPFRILRRCGGEGLLDPLDIERATRPALPKPLQGFPRLIDCLKSNDYF